MYSTAVQIAKTYENYLELSWIQVLMYFYIYVMVSRIDSCYFFLGGHNTWFLYTRPSGNPFWISYELLVTFHDLFLHFQEISMHFLCFSYAVLMHFLCISYAILLHFLCNSFAILMHFLCISYALLMQFLCSFKNFIHFCQNCIHFCPKRMKL